MHFFPEAISQTYVRHLVSFAIFTLSLQDFEYIPTSYWK